MATNRTTGILSATFGLALALIVGTMALLEHMDYYERIEEYLEAWGMGALWVPVAVASFLLVVIAAVSFFFGRIIYLSSPKRSYIGHAWQGAVLVVGGIALFSIAGLIVSILNR